MDAESRPQVARSAAGQPNAPLWKRLAWMTAIWTASVAVLGLFAGLLHLWIG